MLVFEARGNTLRERILTPVLTSSICEILVFAAVFIFALLWIKTIITHNSDDMTDTTAATSSLALESQLKENMLLHAEDMANIIDVRLNEIQNLTAMLAEVTTGFYSAPQNYRPRETHFIGDGEITGQMGEVNLYISKGAVPNVMDEARLAANISDIFKQIGKMDGDITASYLAGEAGFFIITRDDHSAFLNYDARKRSWYINTKTENRLCWSAVYLDISGAGPTITCAAPFYEIRGSQKIFKGIAGNGVVFTNFKQIIETAAPGENTVVFLLDNKGTKLFSSDGSGIHLNEKTGELTSENLLESDSDGLRSLGKMMTVRETGVVDLRINGMVNYVAFCPLTTLDWSLGFSVDERSITKRLSDLRTNIETLGDEAKKGTNQAILIMLFALMLVSIAIISYRVRSAVLLSERIAGPITELVYQVEETGAGNLDAEVTVSAKADELRQLANSFNEMKSRLREYIANLASVTIEKERIAAELDVAARIQMSMLPESFVAPGDQFNVEINGAMFPAKEVGGDFYDFFIIDKTHFAVMIGDVSGKGLQAAMFMVVAKTLVHNHLRQGLPPERALTKLNRELCESNREGMFVTMWVGVFDSETGVLIYVNAGHNPPLVRTNNSSFRYITGMSHDLVTGAFEDTVYHQRSLRLHPEDTLFLYTDGITEATSDTELMYGEDRLTHFLDTHHELDLHELFTTLHDDIKSFVGNAKQSDDITMLALRYKNNQ
ncbi:MAG: SpoIIE family protein phosphatase [Spirochaetaceae bacterium]|nr:SpoIIE family protein phosphatase [Spirochaetaceae bacterium]